MKNALPPLPPGNTRRWVKSRKMAVVKAIEKGALSPEEACRRYDLSEEELEHWCEMARRFGADALRATHVKTYRTQDGVSLGDY